MQKLAAKDWPHRKRAGKPRGGISGAAIQEEVRVIKTISIPNTEKVVSELVEKLDIPFGYFGDFDIAGMDIASRLKLDYIFLPAIAELKDIKGNKGLYQKQQAIMDNRLWTKGFNEAVKGHVDYLAKNKQAYTQERTSALKITHIKVDIFK